MLKNKIIVILTALKTTFSAILSFILSISRTYFLTGLFVLLPSALTLYIIYLLFTWADSGFVAVIFHDFLGHRIPGLGFIFTLTVIIGSGVIAKNVIGKKLFDFIEKVLSKIPLAKNIMNAVRQLLEFMQQNKKSVFNKVVLVEYPRRKCWVIGFVSIDAPRIVTTSLGEHKMYSVFIPTTPNPTSGFLVFVPKTEVVELEITIEEAMKIIISGGVLTPEVEEKGFLVNGLTEDEE
ncbi:MAG: DUF502 domain-containing protein [Candidatus Muiribacteriota bacterium]